MHAHTQAEPSLLYGFLNSETGEMIQEGCMIFQSAFLRLNRREATLKPTMIQAFTVRTGEAGWARRAFAMSWSSTTARELLSGSWQRCA